MMATGQKETSFASYASKKFQSIHSLNFERKPLDEPLHHFKTTLDKDAACAISLAIFRYTKEGEEPQGAFLTKPIFRKLINGLKHGSVDGRFSPSSFIKSCKTTDLEIVQFICGLGILGPQLRDEIYCQIYKQINGNPSDKVRYDGWSLFACCLSSFLPSDQFYPYLLKILKSAPKVERDYCKNKLDRTRQNGKRNEPPSSYEHQAIENRASITVTVHLANGQTCKLRLDAATTGLELKKQLKAVTGIVDLFGFAFCVSIGREIIVIISGDDHVMDVISSCEQTAMKLQLPYTCKLSLFKEIFSPWHSYTADKTSTELIYNQIISSIKSGEYKIKEDSNLGKIIAVQCYLLYGVNTNKKQLEEVTRSFNIQSRKNSSSKHRWLQLVEASFEKKFREKNQVNRIRAAGEVVQYAKLNLTSNFSRIFRCTSSEAPGVNTSLAISCLNVRLYSNKSNHVWKIAFSEMKTVTFEKFKNEKLGTVTVQSIHNEKKQIKAHKAEGIHELLNFFLTGLRKRSRYLFALHDRTQSGNKDGNLEFSCGDLIVLDQNSNGETVEVTGRGYGSCQRTGHTGKISGGLFYIIPVVDAPSDSLLASLRKSFLGSNYERKDYSSDTARTETQSHLESSDELPTVLIHHDVTANAILPKTESVVENVYSYQPVQHSSTSSDSTRHQFAKEKCWPIIDPINIKKESYHELEAEISKSKLHMTSNSESVEGVKSSAFEDISQENASKLNQIDLDPEIVISNGNTQFEKDLINETTVVTASEQLSDQVSVSLEHDAPDKHSEVDVLPENHGDLPAVEENVKKTFLKELEWKTERFGFPSFEDSDSYKAIMTYIQQPAGDIISEVKITDSIFGRPLGNSVSEDHVYREIIRQIEAEENDTRVERSWELMWLITGLYSCSDNIKDEVINFLRARTDSNQLAKQCYMRLVKMITHGRRTYPPHIAEVQAIQTRMDLINHKVFFPDGSCQSFEVESSTTARHLISVITESIGLKYPSGCGLFFKIGDKVFGAADEYFFFDFIQHFIEVWRRTEGGNGIAVNYQVFFLRKVWIDVIPGQDRVADCRLHYYQELSKYLRGYHKCSEKESIILATLILRAEFGEDTEYLSEIPDMLNKLVPQQIIPLKSVDEWQQVIDNALSENVTSFGDDAKIEFLKGLSERPTFGTAFFHVQTNMFGGQPKTLLLAIQKNGLALLTATDKTIIEKYAFTEVEKWASGDKKITIEVKVKEERKKLEFETSLDYQIDDFLTSYISAHGSEFRQESLVSDDE